MKTALTISLSFLVVSLLTISIPARAAEQDVAGSKDHPLFTRMPNFHIYEYKESDFDSEEFYDPAKKGAGDKVTVEGRKFFIKYGISEGVKPPTELQITRNYANAIRKIGGIAYEESSGWLWMKLARDGKEIWARVYVGGNGEFYHLVIVEKASMVQEVVADAKTMAEDISNAGKVAVYGIYFDTNKTEIKQESEPTLTEIARLMKENPALKLHVVGHTDNVGEFSYNMKLSQARAEAAVATLVSKYAVSQNRLKSFGVGPLAPVTSNKTEEGRAKNRRVELVEQ